MQIKIKSLLVGLLVLAIFMAPIFASGQLLTQKMTIQSKERMYLVYLPDGYNSHYTYPVVFMFHGLGSNASFAASSYYGITQLADSHKFIAVFPDSRDDLLPKNFKLGWISVPEYDTIAIAGASKYKRWDIAHIQASNKCTTQDLEFVASIQNTLKSTYKISNNHIYFTGHSYGALFSYYASICMPDKVTAFASHSGGLVKYYWYYFPIAASNAKSNPSLAVPGLLLHSTSDSVVPYSWSQTLQSELTSKGHPNKLISLSVTADAGHGWDKSKNEEQWNWFVANSPAFPEQPAEINFVSTALSGVESSSLVSVEVKLDSAKKAPITVNILVDSSSTASVGTDFTLQSTQVIFNAGETSKNIQLNIVSDKLLESDENIVLTLQFVSGNAYLGTGNKFTYKIIDDTQPSSKVGFVSTSSSGLESVTPVEIPVSMDSARKDPVTVSLAIDSSSTATEGIDFTLSLTSLTFAPGETQKSVQLSILNDAEVEPDELIALTMQVSSGDATLGTNSQYAYTIQNEDEVVIPPKEEKWTPKFLTIMGNHLSILWKEKDQPDWYIQFDYSYEDKPDLIEILYGNYVGYDVKAVEATWTSPNYFWWVLWSHQSGTAGLWRQDSYRDKSLERLVALPYSSDISVKDMCLMQGTPLVLWQYKNGNIRLSKQDIDGKTIGNIEFGSPGEGWSASRVLVDILGKARILFVKDNQILLWMVNPPTSTVEHSYTYTAPEGYTIGDIEFGWDSGAQLTRILWLDANGNAKIWKVDQSTGALVSSFDLSAPAGWKFHSMETTYDDKIRLLVVNGQGNAEIWKINQYSGIKESYTEYTYGEDW